MNKRLETWQIFQRFLDLRSGIILTFLVINTAVMGWVCLRHKQGFPEGYTIFLGVVFSAVTVGKTAKVMKGVGGPDGE